MRSFPQGAWCKWTTLIYRDAILWLFVWRQNPKFKTLINKLKIMNIWASVIAECSLGNRDGKAHRVIECILWVTKTNCWFGMVNEELGTAGTKGWSREPTLEGDSWKSGSSHPVCFKGPERNKALGLAVWIQCGGHFWPQKSVRIRQEGNRKMACLNDLFYRISDDFFPFFFFLFSIISLVGYCFSSLCFLHYLSMFPIFVCLPKSLEDSSLPSVEYG